MTPHTADLLLGIATVAALVFFGLYLISSWDRKSQLEIMKHKVSLLERENDRMFRAQLYSQPCKHQSEPELKSQPKTFSTLLKLAGLALLAFISYKLYRKFRSNSTSNHTVA